MKIILSNQILADVEFMPSCSANSDKICLEIISLAIPMGFLRNK